MMRSSISEPCIFRLEVILAFKHDCTFKSRYHRQARNELFQPTRLSHVALNSYTILRGGSSFYNSSLSPSLTKDFRDFKFTMLPLDRQPNWKIRSSFWCECAENRMERLQTNCDFERFPSKWSQAYYMQLRTNSVRVFPCFIAIKGTPWTWENCGVSKLSSGAQLYL